ncbi:MAG: ABC transporter permease [Planctomycetaceae bacterium]|nr:ABC transporter permease [Planctomycetaceae bacterium]
MKLLLQLILRDARYHQGRIALAVLATTAMSCTIVWLIGSLDLMMLRFDEDAENYLGRYHLALVPENDTPFPQSAVADLENDDFVVQITHARQIRNTMGKMLHNDDTDAAVRRQRSITGLPTQSPSIIGIATDESPFILVEGRWFENADEGVLGTTAAQSLQEWGYAAIEPVQVGDFVICRVGTQDYRIQIVGLVEQNLAGGGRTIDPAVGALYVSMPTARQIVQDDRIDFVYVQLREGTDTRRFAETWGKHFAEQNIEVQFMDVANIQERLNRIRTQDTAGLVGGPATLNSIIIFSALISILIVFTALSMGVTERTRTFAMLRTVGMPRWKMTVLVFGESIILCSLGWLCGTAAGWCVLQLSVWLQPEVFGTGKTVSLGLAPVVTAGIAALLGAILAAILPAWRASRISPLEGMNQGFAQTMNTRWFLPAAVLGMALLFINPILVYGNGIAAADRLAWYTYIGLPTQIIGCLLLVPAMILLVEKYAAPIIARLLRLPKLLLVSQLSSNFWRTLGTTLALSVGLSVYAFLEIAGNSMLVPYMQSKTIPDTLVTFLPTGLPYSEIDAVRNTPGVDSTRFLPIAIDQSHFSQAQSERFMANGLIRMQTSAVVFGIDIEEAFGNRPDGSRPLLELPFQEGTLESALAKLRTGGRYCLVPDSFAARTGVQIGDKLELVLPNARTGGVSPPVIIEYEICGIVSIHGWLWMNKISGVRNRGYRSGAMLLAPYNAVKDDYGLTDAAFFWFDRTLDASGRPTVSDAELEQSLQRLADGLATDRGMSAPRSMVKVNSREYLRERVGDRANDVIRAATKMPLILLAISSFAMMGTIAASVRARRFEFGVLRSLGLTRFRLVRLIVAESLLIAFVVIAVSIGFGVLGSWCFIGLMKYVAIFGGFTSPLTIPMDRLAIGLGVAIICCVFAAIGPAIAAGRTAPTRLLRH